jgi:hypothetical protein
VISDGIHLYGYTSMGGHIVPETHTVNTALMDGCVTHQSTSYKLRSSLHAKIFPIFGKNLELNLSPLKIIIQS